MIQIATNYTKCPNSLIYDENINGNEFRLLMVMIECEGRLSTKKDEYYVTAAWLMKKSGIKSDKTFKKCIKHLKDLGYIKDEKKATHYHINFEAFSAPEKNEVSNSTEEAKEEQIEAKEEETEPVERTLENHPEEDEELIDIMFRIVDSEDPDTLIQEFCNGHNESAELMQHYYLLYKQDKVSELDGENTGNVSELDDKKSLYLNELYQELNWFVRKGRPLSFDVMYSSLDDNTTVEDIYDYTEVQQIFQNYKANVAISA